MPYKILHVQVNRSETSMMTRDIPAWELPVLSAANGDDRVTVLAERVSREDRLTPTAVDEYARLEVKYKDDNTTGMSYVASVYGGGARGIQQLQTEIDRSAVNPLAPPVDSSLDDLVGLPAVEGAVSIDV